MVRPLRRCQQRRFRDESDKADGEAHEEAQRLPPRVLLQQPDLRQLQRAKIVLEVGPRALRHRQGGCARRGGRARRLAPAVALPSAPLCTPVSWTWSEQAVAASPLTPPPRSMLYMCSVCVFGLL
jgi:hypothetical protein